MRKHSRQRKEVLESIRGRKQLVTVKGLVEIKQRPIKDSSKDHLFRAGSGKKSAMLTYILAEAQQALLIPRALVAWV